MRSRSSPNSAGPVRSEVSCGGCGPPSRGDTVLRATEVDGGDRLTGTKVWCSGAGLCTHALVTAQLHDGERGLFAVDLREPGVRPLPSIWHNAGMADSDTRSVQFGEPRPSPSAHLVSIWRGPDSGTEVPVWRRAGSVALGRWPHRCTPGRPPGRPTCTHWRTSVRSTRRSPPPTRRWPRSPSRSTRIPRTGATVANCSPDGPARWSRRRWTRPSAGRPARSDPRRCAWTSSTRSGWPT